MLDPFFNLSVKTGELHEAYASAESDNLSIAVLEAFKESCKPMTGYRALRISSVHAALMSQTMLYGTNSARGLIETILDPTDSVLIESRGRLTPDLFIADILFRVFTAATSAMGELTEKDLGPGLFELNLMNPARAELLQSMHFYWSSGKPRHHEPAAEGLLPRHVPTVDGTEVISPALDAGFGAGRQILVPCFMPKDWLFWQRPNRPHANSRDTYYDYAGIPLAWSPLSDAGEATVGERDQKHGYREFSKAADKSGVAGQSYGLYLGAGDEAGASLVASAQSAGFRILEQANGDPDSAPQWAYAVVAIPTDYSPLSHNRSYGPFNGTGHAIQTMVKDRAKESPFQPELDLKDGERWLGVDAPLYGQAVGVSKAQAMQRAVTLTEKRIEGLGTFGPWAALFSGMRYFPEAIYSGRVTNTPALWEEAGPENFPQDTSAPLPIPNEQMMKVLMSIQDNRVGRIFNLNGLVKDTAKFGMGIGQYNPVPNKAMYGAYLSRGDITFSRKLISAGAISCTAELIRQMDKGHFGPLGRKWLKEIIASMQTYVDIALATAQMKLPHLIQKRLEMPVRGSQSSYSDAVKKKIPINQERYDAQQERKRNGIGYKKKDQVHLLSKVRVYKGPESAPIVGMNMLNNIVNSSAVHDRLRSATPEDLATMFETLAAMHYANSAQYYDQVRKIVLQDKKIIRQAQKRMR